MSGREVVAHHPDRVIGEGSEHIVEHSSDKLWFHPQSGHVVSDVKPDNFKQDAKGRIIPIDLIVQHAPPGSDLRRVMEDNI